MLGPVSSYSSDSDFSSKAKSSSKEPKRYKNTVSTNIDKTVEEAVKALFNIQSSKQAAENLGVHPGSLRVYLSNARGVIKGTIDPDKFKSGNKEVLKKIVAKFQELTSEDFSLKPVEKSKPDEGLRKRKIRDSHEKESKPNKPKYVEHDYLSLMRKAQLLSTSVSSQPEDSQSKGSIEDLPLDIGDLPPEVEKGAVDYSQDSSLETDELGFYVASIHPTPPLDMEDDIADRSQDSSPEVDEPNLYPMPDDTSPGLFPESGQSEELLSKDSLDNLSLYDDLPLNMGKGAVDHSQDFIPDSSLETDDVGFYINPATNKLEDSQVLPTSPWPDFSISQSSSLSSHVQPPAAQPLAPQKWTYFPKTHKKKLKPAEELKAEKLEKAEKLVESYREWKLKGSEELIDLPKGKHRRPLKNPLLMIDLLVSKPDTQDSLEKRYGFSITTVKDYKRHLKSYDPHQKSINAIVMAAAIILGKQPGVVSSGSSRSSTSSSLEKASTPPHAPKAIVPSLAPTEAIAVKSSLEKASIPALAPTEAIVKGVKFTYLPRTQKKLTPDERLKEAEKLVDSYQEWKLKGSVVLIDPKDIKREPSNYPLLMIDLLVSNQDRRVKETYGFNVKTVRKYRRYLKNYIEKKEMGERTNYTIILAATIILGKLPGVVSSGTSNSTSSSPEQASTPILAPTEAIVPSLAPTGAAQPDLPRIQKRKLMPDEQLKEAEKLMDSYQEWKLKGSAVLIEPHKGKNREPSDHPLLMIDLLVSSPDTQASLAKKYGFDESTVEKYKNYFKNYNVNKKMEEDIDFTIILAAAIIWSSGEISSSSSSSSSSV